MTKLYLDLEGTVIDSWDNFRVINAHRVRKFLDDNPDVDRNDVRLFSFAIYNSADIATARFHLDRLEHALRCKITAVPSVADMVAVNQEYTGVAWGDSDGLAVHQFINVKRKMYAWVDHVFATEQDGTRAVLIDDVVPTRTVIDHKRAMQLDLINVDDLK